ncbi:protein kinase domain-containing protein [Pseudomonas capsici]|uniref:protein kinase domain-containing protein n=1 Tax=Pseudomonas capsici TaxID=2810614 RepID=UPI0021F14748|nr:protein kinase [Pseudomonas capsici]MCV4341116.1 protein kinase [Pseudomonas capsici]
MKILRSIASGAHGTVFEGIDLDIDRHIAVKIWYKSGKKVSEGAMREVRRLAAMAHPLFVTVYRLDIAGDYPFAMMELIHGDSLKGWLKKQAIKEPKMDNLLEYLAINKESIRQRCAFWCLYSQGLKHVYSQGTLHGDPHTGNILIYEDKAGILKTFYEHHVLRSGSYSSLKIIDLGTSFLWKDPDGREQRELDIISETAERLFPDFKPSDIMFIGAELEPVSLLKVFDRFVEYILGLVSVPSMTEDDFVRLEHSLPQLLGWCPFFNYSRVSVHLSSIFKMGEAEALIRDALWQLENKNIDVTTNVGGRSARRAHSSFEMNVDALTEQSKRLQVNNWIFEPSD